MSQFLNCPLGYQIVPLWDVGATMENTPRDFPLIWFFSLGFNMSTGVPKVGILQNAAWNLSDMCRFKLLPPPQPDRSVSDKDKRELQVSFIYKNYIILSIIINYYNIYNYKNYKIYNYNNYKTFKENICKLIHSSGPIFINNYLCGMVSPVVPFLFTV